MPRLKPRPNFPLDLGDPALGRKNNWRRAAESQGYNSLSEWIRVVCDREAEAITAQATKTPTEKESS